MATVKSNSFLTFVYPITLESGNFDKIVEAVGVPDSRFRIWETDEFPHEELLPHIADYLSAQDDNLSTARLCSSFIINKKQKNSLCVKLLL